jgi:hypothetical protein
MARISSRSIAWRPKPLSAVRVQRVFVHQEQFVREITCEILQSRSIHEVDLKHQPTLGIESVEALDRCRERGGDIVTQDR